MKKIISVFLSVLMLFGLCSVAASAAEADELVITVANDLHYNTTYTALSSHKANSLNEDFAHVGLDTRLPYEAKAIINAFVEQVKASIDAAAIAEDMKVKKAMDLVKETAKITKPRKPAAKKKAAEAETEAVEATETENTEA